MNIVATDRKLHKRKTSHNKHINWVLTSSTVLAKTRGECKS